MPIIPTGKKRIMMAQNLADGNNFGNIQFPELPNTQNPVSQENIVSEQPTGQPQDGQSQKETPPNTERSGPEDNNSEPDLSEYLFKFLEERGYPPRRLEQYEEEFVTEEMFPGETREVTVVLPDRYYGSKKRLSKNDLNTLIKDIQAKFGLSFVKGERKDKKLTINLTSQQQAQPSEEDATAGDALDEVFGAGTKKEQPKDKKKVAKTINELLKESNDALVEKLLKMGAEKNGK